LKEKCSERSLLFVKNKVAGLKERAYLYGKSKIKVMENITSKAGLVGYLQGNILGIIGYLELTPEEERTSREEAILSHLKKIIVETEELWEKIRLEKY